MIYLKFIELIQELSVTIVWYMNNHSIIQKKLSIIIWHNSLENDQSIGI